MLLAASALAAGDRASAQPGLPPEFIPVHGGSSFGMVQVASIYGARNTPFVYPLSDVWQSFDPGFSIDRSIVTSGPGEYVRFTSDSVEFVREATSYSTAISCTQQGTAPSPQAFTCGICPLVVGGAQHLAPFDVNRRLIARLSLEYSGAGRPPAIYAYWAEVWATGPGPQTVVDGSLLRSQNDLSNTSRVGYVQLGPRHALGYQPYEYRCGVDYSVNPVLASSFLAAATVTASLTIVGPCTTGLAQPVSIQDACPGTNATFTYLVEGVPDLAYQWRRNGVALIEGPTPWGSEVSGSTGPTLTIDNLRPNPAVGPGGDSASYDCVVTSPIGLCTSATSAPATLTVRDGVLATPCVPAPSFTLQPAPATVTAGGTARFEATAQTTCVGRYHWLWRDAGAATWTALSPGFNGVAPGLPAGGGTVASTGGVIVSGEATDVLDVQTIQLRHGSPDAAAEFRCVVTDDCGETWSNGALLTVKPADTTPPNTPDTPGICCNPLTGACFAATAGSTPPGYIFTPAPATCDNTPCPAQGIACCTGSTCTVLPYGPCLGGGIIVATCGPDTCPARHGVCCSPTTGACTEITGNYSCPAGFVLTLGVASCGALSPCPMPNMPPPSYWIPIPPAGACCRGATCTVTWSAFACSASGGSYLPGGSCGPSTTPPQGCCRADFNQDTIVNIDDIFIYLNAWFAADPRCDVNDNAIVEIDDVFVFINVWNARC